MTSEEYKAENVLKESVDGEEYVHIENSASFNNPIAQMVYADYLYENVKKKDGSRFFDGDPYDIVGEWQAHNVAAIVIKNVKPRPATRKLTEFIFGKSVDSLYDRSIHADIGSNIDAENEVLVRFASKFFKELSRCASFDVLNW